MPKTDDIFCGIYADCNVRFDWISFWKTSGIYQQRLSHEIDIYCSLLFYQFLSSSTFPAAFYVLQRSFAAVVSSPGRYVGFQLFWNRLHAVTWIDVDFPQLENCLYRYWTFSNPLAFNMELRTRESSLASGTRQN